MPSVIISLPQIIMSTIIEQIKIYEVKKEMLLALCDKFDVLRIKG